MQSEPRQTDTTQYATYPVGDDETPLRWEVLAVGSCESLLARDEPSAASPSDMELLRSDLAHRVRMFEDYLSTRHQHLDLPAAAAVDPIDLDNADDPRAYFSQVFRVIERHLGRLDADRDRLQAEIEQTRAERDALERDLTGAGDQLEARTASLNDQISRLKKELQTTIGERESLRDESTKLSASLEQSYMIRDELADAIDDARAEQSQAKTAAEERHAELMADLSSAKAQLRAVVNERDALRDEAPVLRTELEQTQQQLNSAGQQLASAASEQERLESDLASVRTIAHGLQREKQRLEEELATLTRQSATAQSSADSEIDILRAEREASRARAVELQRRHDELNTRLEAAQRETQTLMLERSALQATVEEAHQRITETTTQFERRLVEAETSLQAQLDSQTSEQEAARREVQGYDCDAEPLVAQPTSSGAIPLQLPNTIEIIAGAGVQSISEDELRRAS